MLPNHRRAFATLITAVSLGLIATGLSVGPAQAAPIAGDGQIKINEVESSDQSTPTLPDWVELTNIGASAVDISGWLVTDNDDSHTKIPVPNGTTLQPGGFYVVPTDVPPYNTGLGSADSARLYAPDGTTLEDSYSWTSHAGQTYGRCTDGTGAFVNTYAPTPGGPNDCSPVIINEVNSTGTDWVELYNVTNSSQDISGWDFRDNKDTDHYAIPAGTVIPAHSYWAVTEDDAGGANHFSFGLGGADSARLFTSSSGTLLDGFTWTSAPATTYGRCYDSFGRFVPGTGAWAATASATQGAVNDCTPPAPVGPDYSGLKINEVVANGDAVGDWVELVNNGKTDLDISGFTLVDSDAAHDATPVVIPANTTIKAGAYYSIYTEHFQNTPIGLDTNDSVTLYQADGTTQVDTTSWTNLTGTSWGRCPDATGGFQVTAFSTKDAPNACSPVRINEIQPDDATGGPDWIELYNTSSSPVDISGWNLKDNKDSDNYAIPAGTTIAAHGFWTDTELDGSDPAHFNFGLGAGGDSVRLYATNDTTLLDSYSWTAAPDSATTAAGDTTFGRYPDGTGDFLITDAPTFGAPNSHTHVATTPWPGSQTVDWADNANTWNGDLSGLAFDPTDPTVVWGAQNKAGTLWKLTQDPASHLWVPASGWSTGKDPHYKDGSGHPDAEGIGFGPDGAVYLSSERDNDNNGVSRASVLRYDQNGSGPLNATDEWNLSSALGLGNAQANLGLEGVTWVPDSYLLQHGFVDQSTGAAYNPANYPGHGTGLFFVAVENNGDLYAFALNGAGTGNDTFNEIATIPTDSSKIADVSFNPERQNLWAVCDDSCTEIPGALEQLTIGQDGAFHVTSVYDRPQGMPDYNNEGFAIAPRSTCTGGNELVLWSDDGNDESHSLRSGSIPCAPALTSAPPVITGTAKVGETVTATTPGWNDGTAFTYQWSLAGTPVSGATSSSFAVPVSAAGKALTVTVGGSLGGFTTADATSDATTVALGTAAAGQVAVSGTARVGETVTATTSGWAAGTAFSYQWSVAGSPVAGATAASFAIPASASGNGLSVTVTGSLAGYADAQASSPASIVSPGTATAGKVALSGTAKVGKTVTATSSGWAAGTKLSYQWLLSGKKVSSHGTSKSFAIPASAKGKKLTVTVTGSLAGYTTASAASAGKTVAAGALKVGKIALSGTAKVGKKLTAKPSGWTKGATFSYQWYASGKALISGKKATFSISHSLAGKTLKVKVTAKLTGYANASKVSGTTKKVAR